jgi:hypothetical protein
MSLLRDTLERDKKDTPFCCFAQKLREIPPDKLETIINSIAVRVTGRKEWKSIAPSPFPPNDERNRAFQVIWYTIQLLNILSNPMHLSPDEVQFYRNQLSAPALETPSHSKSSSLDIESTSESPDVPRCHKVGVISGRFVDTSEADRIFTALSGLQSPTFQVQKTVLYGWKNGKQKLLDFVLDHLRKPLDSFRSREPRDLYQGLLRVSGLSMQLVMAVRISEKVNVSPLIQKFTELTEMILAVKRRQPGPLFPKLVDTASQSLVNAWNDLNRPGIPFLNLLVICVRRWMVHLSISDV